MKYAYLFCHCHQITYAKTGGPRQLLQNLQSIPLNGPWTDLKLLEQGMGNLLLGWRQKRRPLKIMVEGLPVMGKVIRIPRVEAKNRETVIRSEFAQVCPVPLEDLCWFPITVHTDGIEEQVLVLSISREIVDKIIQAAHSRGLRVHSIQPTAHWLYQAIRREGSEKQCLILCHDYGAMMLATDGTEMCLRTPRLSIRKEHESYPGELMTEIIRFIRMARIKLPDFDAGVLWIYGIQAHRLETSAATDPSFSFREILQPALADTASFSKHACPFPSEAACPGIIPAFIHQTLNKQSAYSDFLPEPYRMVALNAVLRRNTLAGSLCLMLAMASFAISEWKVAMSLSEETEQWQRIAQRTEILRHQFAHEYARSELLIRDVRRIESLHARQTIWIQILEDLQHLLSEVEDVWIDTWHRSDRGGFRTNLKEYQIAGRMVDRENPMAHSSVHMRERVNALLDQLASSPFVTGIGDMRFDTREQGLLRFSFTLSLDSSTPP